MLLMALEGRFGDFPDCAIFADTQAEPESVYRWLGFLQRVVRPFSIHVVSRGSLTKAALTIKERKDGTGSWAASVIPAFIKNPDGSTGMIQRQCTYDWKVRELTKAARKLASVPRGAKSVLVEQWIGISTDEAHRMKPSREQWIKNRFPLIEAGLSRVHCLDFFKSKGMPQPPKSACIYCPFHSDSEWIRLKKEEPEEFEKACRFDEDYRAVKTRTGNMHGQPYLHRSLRPLRQVEFMHENQRPLDLWGNECEGVCGI